MPDWWAWAAYGATLGLTVGGKVACNAYVPGSSAVVEFCSAGKCLYDGDMIGAAISAVSGIADLVSFGLAGSIKDAMKGSAKTAATETAKQTAKSASEEATKQLAKGAIKGAKDAAIDAAKMATKQVGRKYGKELGKGVITQAVEKAYYQGTKMTFQSLGQTGFLAGVSSGGKQVGEIISKEVLGEILTKTAERTLYETAKESQKFAFTEAAKKGAEEMFKKQAYKLLVTDVACAGAKAAIRCDSSDREQGLTHWLDWIVSPTVKLWPLKELQSKY